MWYQLNAFKLLSGLGVCPFLGSGSVIAGSLFIVAPIVNGGFVLNLVLLCSTLCPF